MANQTTNQATTNGKTKVELRGAAEAAPLGNAKVDVRHASEKGFLNAARRERAQQEKLVLRYHLREGLGLEEAKSKAGAVSSALTDLLNSL